MFEVLGVPDVVQLVLQSIQTEIFCVPPVLVGVRVKPARVQRLGQHLDRLVGVDDTSLFVIVSFDQ